MKVSISRSEIAGEVRTPSSKSMTIRALMCAALAKGESEIIDPLVSDDTNTAAEVLGKIGVYINKEKNVWKVTGGSLRVPGGDLYCGESATTMRFMIAISSLIPGEYRLIGGPSLSKRPVRSLIEALKMLGVKGSIEGKATPPVTISGGKLLGGQAEIPGHISSQFISALLLVAPFAEKKVSIKLTTPLASRPYVLMTLECMREFGVNVTATPDRFIVKPRTYTPVKFRVEGDWSSASYFLALGAFSDAGVKVENIRTSSLQGDRVLLGFLRSMGAQVKVTGDSVTVSKGDLKAIKADLSDCIDLLPTMAILAATATGVSELTGIERARIKESNRIAAIKEGLEKMDVTVSGDKGRLCINGLAAFADASARRENAVIDSHNDHRIAMAFGILGTAVGNVIIEGAECVTKTYPDFWNSLKSVGGQLRIDQ
jgi:3-phosphoshikimate 1-carboxyvinyltransferase